MAFLKNHDTTSKSENNVNNGISDLHGDNNVRVLLFREFGSEGRKLLFDSYEIKTLPHNVSSVAVNSSINFHRLTEMVFGSVSLRCRETYFRIHNLPSPNSIMFTQIFPSPGSRKMKPFTRSRRRVSSTIRNLDSFYSEGERCNSAASDNSLTFELRTSGLGLEVFHNKYDVSTSTSTFDSGYEDQSFGSFTISNRSSFSSDTTLDRNKISNLATYSNLTDTNLYYKASTLDCSTRAYPTLGLVIILAVTSDNEEYLKCYMKQIAFIESVVFRIRRSIDMAVGRTGILQSLMVEASCESYKWLNRIFPELQKHSINEINKCRSSNRYCEEMHHGPLKLKITSLMFKINLQKSSIVRDIIFPKKYNVQSNTGASVCNESEKYFTEFCELINILENKETNFFASTIITATLTYHLGWINTCFPFPLPNIIQQFHNSSYNSLWKQIAELCGANGSPIKSCQTIVNGQNRNEMVTKILHFIHYFIRYTTILYNYTERADVSTDNETVDMICSKHKKIGNYSTERFEPRKPSGQGMISKLNKSKAWSNLFELSQDESCKENCLPQENKVKFLLGDNEELINIKPTSISNIKTAPHENLSVAKNKSVDSSKHLLNMFKHSNSCPVLDDLWKSVTQKYHSTRFRILNKIESKRSKSESPKIMKEKIFNFENRSSERDLKMEFNHEKIPVHIHYQPINLNLPLSEENRQVLCVNKKQRTFHKITKMKFFSFPLPKSEIRDTFKTTYASKLQSNTVGQYVPDLVIQGTNFPQEDWKLKLKRDLYLTRQIYFLDGYVDESVAIVGNTDTWDVEIISSRISINQTGMRLDISSLIGNMFDVLLQMHNLRLCKKYCTTHIEQRLLEICIRAYAFGQLLLHTDMCTMDLLTTTLHFEINDVPLLMSVASIIVPEVTKKYGLSFQ